MAEISPISEVAQGGAAPYPALQSDVPTKQARESTRLIAAAVQKVNSAQIAGEGREVTFSFDHATRQPVVKVVDTSTREVVQQWPPEYLLQLAAESKTSPRDSG